MPRPKLDASDRKIVWILGAGFSAHLGGPLFRTLLTPECRRRIPGQILQNEKNAAGAAQWLYNWGTRFEFGRLPTKHWKECGDGERLWEDAEAFLDYLDTAITSGKNSPLHVQLEQLLYSGPGEFFKSVVGGPDGLENVAEGAKQLLAAECGAFLRGNIAVGERWKPYEHWKENLLQPNDVVLSFNYDRVLEVLDPEEKRLKVILPHEQPPTDRAAALKLHGSITWERNDEGKYSRHADPDFWISGGKRIGIASPGPSKETSTEELRKLWDLAMGALKSADAIVLLGYRFPPSDSIALGRLIDAMRENVRPHVSYHAVLGPERSHMNVLRLEQLLLLAAAYRGRAEMTKQPRPLEAAHRTYSVVTQPLFAQDFMALMTRPAVAFPYCLPPPSPASDYVAKITQ